MYGFFGDGFIKVLSLRHDFECGLKQAQTSQTLYRAPSLTICQPSSSLRKVYLQNLHVWSRVAPPAAIMPRMRIVKVARPPTPTLQPRVPQTSSTTSDRPYFPDPSTLVPPQKQPNENPPDTGKGTLAKVSNNMASGMEGSLTSWSPLVAECARVCPPRNRRRDNMRSDYSSVCISMENTITYADHPSIFLYFDGAYSPTLKLHRPF